MRVRSHHSSVRSLIVPALAAVLLAAPAPATLAWGHDHANIPNRERVEPSATISIGVGDRAQLPVYVTVGPADLGAKSGFGVKVFVDTVPLYTNETVLTAAHSFVLDLRRLGVGYHYILANICDHSDHIGAAAVWIQVTRDLRVIRYSDAPPELVERWKAGITGWPGKLTIAPTPLDPAADDVYLNCCGDYSPWTVGAHDTDRFAMRPY